MHVADNPVYVANFYDLVEHREHTYAYVQQVSAIVGENGSGKSTFLDFIKSNFARGGGGFREAAIVVLENVSSQSLHLYHHKDTTLDETSIQLLSGKNISIHTYGPSHIQAHPSTGIKNTIIQYGEIEATYYADYIYFSNIFDSHPEDEVEGMRNISTNYLVRDGARKSQEMGKDINPLQVVDNFRFAEIERELNFINAFREGYKEFISFPLPSVLGTFFVNIEYLKNFTDFSAEVQQLKDKLVGFFDTRLSQANTAEHFILSLSQQAIINAFVENTRMGRFYLHPDASHFDWTGLQQSTIKESLHLLLAKLDGDYQFDSSHKTPFFFIGKLIDFFYEEFEVYDRGFATDGYRFDIGGQQGQDRFFTFYNFYRDSFSIDPYLGFAWPSLSSGEEAMLSIYSRLFSLSDLEVRNRGANLILQRDIVLLLDEGELYLHPTWQKSILSDLLKILPVIFNTEEGEPRNIQIILTSNSPLLLSDIPATNVVFLERKKRDRAIFSDVQDILAEHKQTFAANIHTLLADSFFMREGLIGKFAAIRINEVIRDLSAAANISESRREDIRKIIQQVGEPVIKAKLMQQYNDKFNLQIHVRLDELERRVKNLE